MATLSTLNELTTRLIAQQIAEFIELGVVEFGEAEELEIAEGLPVWMLTAADVFAPNALTPVNPLGQWHHQIHQGGSPIGFARSRIYGPKAADWQVFAVFRSPLAEAIDRAITTVDRLDSTGEARLLLVPAWHVTALWIADEEAEQHTFLITQDLPINQPALNKQVINQPLRTGDFLEILRQLPPVDGNKRS
ncbi:hypothetical protein BEN47_15285 [Hymenobacter lapidarius]|uniref:Uncharacterized protein n=1 Tax=Hymenobacter lapidarius TaxID=1908237 RepID=A0A1G1T2I1_9BACT|nr:hypothetical protein [Hymenobacter lapidarius]OGX85079.1 hypothetical protein BEN47_15285 [Hymenobacter lapidarius]